MTGSSREDYPSETSGLLSADGGPDDRKKWWSPVFTCVILALLVLMSANLIYDYYLHSPKNVENRLVRKYEKVAHQSMELLSDLSANRSGSDTSIPPGCESTVLILRHCEDLGGHVRYDDGTSHCSYFGFQRSLYLATLFGNATAVPNENPPRWPLPSRLYGLWNIKKTNKRQYELLRPLSDKSGVPIQMYAFETAAQDLRSDLFDLLQTGQFCDKVAVVAWKHKFIRTLAAELGCDQEKGCPGGNEFAWDDYDFDTVWELQYVYQPEALRAFPNTEDVHEHKQMRLVDGWKVFGSVTHEYFDALEFSREAYGDNETDNWMSHISHHSS